MMTAKNIIVGKRVYDIWSVNPKEFSLEAFKTIGLSPANLASCLIDIY